VVQPSSLTAETVHTTSAAPKSLAVSNNKVIYFFQIPVQKLYRHIYSVPCVLHTRPISYSLSGSS
jgi:hypothetical protein